MMKFSTCDLCDAHEKNLSQTLHLLPDTFRRFGAERAFAGPVHTVKCHNDAGVLDNSKVREAVAEPGVRDGVSRVLVIDGAGLAHRALLGGNLAVMAAKNGWAGVLVNGAVRDAQELREAELAVRALALCPMRTEKLRLGERGESVEIAGVKISEGDWLYADEDGVVVSRHCLS
jgi:regulator of ribonuclease activity A